MALALLCPSLGPASAALSGREVRCLALVAYTEAAVDGLPGMTAVIRVVRNRMADPRFPDDACAVILQVAQFQPIAQSKLLQQVARDPEGYSLPQILRLRSPEARALLVAAHRLARTEPSEPDPTGGALYFVNPDYMNRDLCPWFAALKRTAVIGGHVFMTHYEGDEPRGGAALDCARAGRAARVQSPAAARSALGQRRAGAPSRFGQPVEQGQGPPARRMAEQDQEVAGFRPGERGVDGRGLAGGEVDACGGNAEPAELGPQECRNLTRRPAA